MSRDRRDREMNISSGRMGVRDQGGGGQWLPDLEARTKAKNIMKGDLQ